MEDEKKLLLSWLKNVIVEIIDDNNTTNGSN